ncbi:histone acetylation protein-domain-containing protein [Epithele typhae]|uniref:histone acetylation protein-domain-containing protein n=1 Tax=Epithele typhae TaxID=378194 RepID=UPI002007C541|nr:histone acetylation protein-domain-containing protein [Epithele typhae]KAH9925447.1 histone acetylation protein-domain-containing protein [Epithele typhae]
MSLRDKLLAALADLPGTRTFHVHVLTSAPRKHTGLFPYAHPRPRTYLQHVFILLSEQGTDADAPCVLTTAIEAMVYHVPTTSCGILYVSKVDSSGHATSPSPTPILVHAFLSFYADPVTRPLPVQHLWIQLFARAQNQYLFPNSSEYEGKRPLSDVRLCAWWKRLYGEVATGVADSLKGTGAVRLWYVLPGYSEHEAFYTLTRAPAGEGGAASAVPWAYGHPYAQDEIPLPCPRGADPAAPHNLGNYIPWFDDDPKSRFLDEIAHTNQNEAVRSPQKKRPRPPNSTASAKAADESEVDEAGKDKEAEKGTEKERDKDDKPHIQGELSQVVPDEFWERMSFRQECVAGAVTGFFTLAVSTPPPPDQDKKSLPSPLAPKPGQVAVKMVERVISALMKQNEFSTREYAVRATETIEAAIRGLCQDGPVLPAPASVAATPAPRTNPHTPQHWRCRAPLRAPLAPPREGAKRGGAARDLAKPVPRPGRHPETYADFIYGCIAVRNPPLAPKTTASTRTSTTGQAAPAASAAPVTVLQVRKKRKTAS